MFHYSLPTFFLSIFFDIFIGHAKWKFCGRGNSNTLTTPLVHMDGEVEGEGIMGLGKVNFYKDGGEVKRAAGGRIKKMEQKVNGGEKLTAG
jgi:predicted chitinase